MERRTGLKGRAGVGEKSRGCRGEHGGAVVGGEGHQENRK